MCDRFSDSVRFFVPSLHASVTQTKACIPPFQGVQNVYPPFEGVQNELLDNAEKAEKGERVIEMEEREEKEKMKNIENWLGFWEVTVCS